MFAYFIRLFWVFSCQKNITQKSCSGLHETQVFTLGQWPEKVHKWSSKGFDFDAFGIQNDHPDATDKKQEPHSSAILEPMPLPPQPRRSGRLRDVLPCMPWRGILKWKSKERGQKPGKFRREFRPKTCKLLNWVPNYQ